MFSFVRACVSLFYMYLQWACLVFEIRKKIPGIQEGWGWALILGVKSGCHWVSGSITVANSINVVIYSHQFSTLFLLAWGERKERSQFYPQGVFLTIVSFYYFSNNNNNSNNSKWGSFCWFWVWTWEPDRLSLNPNPTTH